MLVLMIQGQDELKKFELSYNSKSVVSEVKQNAVGAERW